MSLLIDDIRVGKSIIVPPVDVKADLTTFSNWRKWVTPVVTSGLAVCQAIKIDNVARYYYETRCQTWRMAEDFPILTPPFTEFWMEYSPPKKILELEDPSTVDFDNGIWDAPKDAPKVLRDARGIMGRAGIFCAGREVTDPARPTVTHELLCSVFAEDPTSPRVVAGGAIHYFELDQKGAVVKFSPLGYGTDREHGLIVPDYKAATLQSIPAYLAISFMHCKNVRVKQEQPDQRVSKYFNRRHGLPMMRFRVLEIEPMKRVLESEGGSASQGISKAMHICRGHFKDYREKGLGKTHAKGLWWWDAHVRGNKDLGEVEKVYNVNPKVA